MGLVPAYFVAYALIGNARTLFLDRGRRRNLRVIPSSPLHPVNFHLVGEIDMTRIRNIITSGVLVLSFVTISYAGTITGSRTGATGSRFGTITGSRSGTITGSRVGTITGSTVTTITRPEPRILSQGSTLENIQSDFLFRLMSLVLNGAW